MPRRPPLLRVAVQLAVASLLGATLLAVAPWAPSGTPWPVVARAVSTCTGWPDRTTPPTTIRVLRTAGNAADTVAVVPFREYVNVVMAAEWGPSNPIEALKAGAVAVKQYAWYRAMVWRGGTAKDGSCYDVVDSTIDQVYAPETHPPIAALTAAVDATWGISLRKSGRLFPTHYEGGTNVACAANADGAHLYQVSAMRCARDGMTAEAILDAYYGPGVEIIGGASVDASPSPSTSPSPSPSASPVPALPSPALVLHAAASLVTWGQGVRFDARIEPPGKEGAGGRIVHLQRTVDGVAWTTVADLKTGAKGTASRVERPAANASYRLAFDGTAELGPATSPAVEVRVRRVALLQPGDAAAALHVAQGASVTFVTLVRPTRASVAKGTVLYRLLRLAGRSWVVARSWTVTPDDAGRARLRVTFPSRGTWSVRAMAVRTTTNADSTWASSRRYIVP